MSNIQRDRFVEADRKKISTSKKDNILSSPKENIYNTSSSDRGILSVFKLPKIPINQQTLTQRSYSQESDINPYQAPSIIINKDQNYELRRLGTSLATFGGVLVFDQIRKFSSAIDPVLHQFKYLKDIDVKVYSTIALAALTTFSAYQALKAISKAQK